jgi:NADPH:quinone reductase-like Zn-dependent oxidoreductase
VVVKAAAVSYETRLLDQITALVERGALKPIVGTAFPFSQVVTAYEQVMTGHARGKIVLKMVS